MQCTATGHRHLVRACRESQRGASAVEYALLIALIAAVIVFAVSALGLSVIDLLAINLTP